MAVLAVDPSSSVSGGSILGDKTRMADLGRDPAAFIRPTPSSGTLGGVARRTREAMLLCEAAGFDVVIVETVGVGQSEVAVADLVDLFVLVASPAGGDELQGIKRGIMELADVIAVNKADGDLADAAQRAAGGPAPRRPPPAAEATRLGGGRAHLLGAHGRRRARALGSRSWRPTSGWAATGLTELRAGQDVAWMWSEVTDTLLDRLRSHPHVRGLVPELEASVARGDTSATVAARRLLDAFLGDE